MSDESRIPEIIADEAPQLGRPTKFNDSVREKILELAEKGKTIAQIAEIIGVSTRTLYFWQGRHPDLLHALKEAKQTADELVEASLFARAVGYSHPEQKVFLHEGEVVTHDMIKHYPPDTTAAIFWLKNRKPKSWADTQKVEHSGGQEIKITVTKVDLDARVKQLKGEE